MTEWVSADDRRNVLLKNIESRMVTCETLIHKLLERDKQVLQMLSTMKVHTQQLQTVSQQLISISQLLVQIIGTNPKTKTKITQNSMRV